MVQYAIALRLELSSIMNLWLPFVGPAFRYVVYFFMLFSITMVLNAACLQGYFDPTPKVNTDDTGLDLILQVSTVLILVGKK